MSLPNVVAINPVVVVSVWTKARPYPAASVAAHEMFIYCLKKIRWLTSAWLLTAALLMYFYQRWSLRVRRIIFALKCPPHGCICILRCLYVYDFTLTNSLCFAGTLFLFCSISEDTNFPLLIPHFHYVSVFLHNSLTQSISLISRLRILGFWMLSVPGGNIWIWFCGWILKYSLPSDIYELWLLCSKAKKP